MLQSDGEPAWQGKTYNALKDKKHLTGINKEVVFAFQENFRPPARFIAFTYKSIVETIFRNRRLRVEREGNAALSGGASTIEQTWPKERTGQTEVKALDRRAVIEALQAKLRQLPPQNDAQPWLQSRGRIKKPAP